MNPFDLAVIGFLNQFAQRSWLFDKFVVVISGNQLLKGGVLITLVWYAWFADPDSGWRQRRSLLATIVGCGFAIVLARGLALLLPFRLRPVHTPAIGFELPIGTTPAVLEGWSAFPSDHAVLFYALSAGLWLVSRRLGVFALIYTTVVIALPRIYLGLHFPTDIIAGALIGFAVVAAANKLLADHALIHRTVAWSSSHPRWFYPLFFLLRSAQ